MSKSLEAAREAAIEWLLHSGIRNPDGPLAGSFNAWHDGTWGWAYSEVTGYGITLLCGLHAEAPSAGHLDAALASGRWLLEQARSGPAYRCRYQPGSGWLDHLCAFDNGMILNALCHLFRATGDRVWLDAANGVADWLTGRMALAGGGLVAKRQADGGIPDTPARWSSRTGPYQAKVALGLAHLARCTGNADRAREAQRLCRWATGFQQPDGRFVTDEALQDTYLHAHLYVVEGLLATAALTDAPELARTTGAALDWTRSAATPEGGLSGRYLAGTFETAERSDSTAQALRLLAITGADPDRVPRLAARLLELQCLDGNPARHGGFRYSRSGDAFTTNVTAHGTMFAIQALDRVLGVPAGFDWAGLV